MLGVRLKSLVKPLLKIMHVMDFKVARRAKCDTAMLIAFKLNDIEKIEDCIVKFSRVQSPSTWAVTFYIGKVVHQGRARRLNEIINSKKIRPDHLPLLLSASYRVSGNYIDALRALKYDSKSSLVRYKTAQAERSLHHQMQNWESKAIAAIEYIKADPDRKLLEFALHAAGSAENAGREDLVRIALSRAIRDMRTVKASSRLIRKHWKEAALVSQHIFDLRGAAFICQRAAMMGCSGAKAEHAKLVVLLTETESIRDLLGAAYRDMRVRAGELVASVEPADVEIIMHAAAIRMNKIDYKGFRKDIRFCYEVIAQVLAEKGVKARIRGKLLVHGSINAKVPYFSYHTIATNNLGLHFKEVDRPGSFSFDTRGYSGWSQLADTMIEDLGLDKIDQTVATNFFLADSNKVITSGTSKYKQAFDIDEGLPDSFIFIGLQVVGDAVQSLAYMSAIAMIEEVLTTAARLKLKVVIKRHPYCKSAHLANFIKEGVSQGIFFVATGNIHKLIERSVAVCVVNSAVGSEALLHNKPVYVFGKSEYMRACYICQYKGDFNNQFILHQCKLSEMELHRYFYYIKKIYAVDLTARKEARILIRTNVIEHLKIHGLINK